MSNSIRVRYKNSSNCVSAQTTNSMVYGLARRTIYSMPSLNWIGREAVLHHHKCVPFHLLHEDLSLSAGNVDADNLLVQGDNLLALKALLPRYGGQVKCIYIDPPYNTGNEGWVYNDNVNSPEMRKWLHNVVGKEGEDLSRHDKWLCMMYPRLQLLRQMLRPDGVIFVSIDDNEVAHLRLLMDELFGASNFVADIVWQSRKSVSNDTLISFSHNYNIVYARNKTIIDMNKAKFRLPMDADKFKNPDNDPRGAWTADPFDAPNIRINLSYPIVNPNTGRTYLPPSGRCWRTTQDEYKRLLAEGRILFGKTGKSKPQYKRFLREVEQKGDAPTTWWDDVGTTTTGTQLLESIMGAKVFDNPKPIDLIKRMVQLATDKDGDIVMDSFVGSGTTGHAVMQLNAEDGGNRRFVLVEIEPHIAQTVTAERLRRVLAAQQEQNPSLLPTTGFRFCTLGAPVFDADGNPHLQATRDDVARHILWTETGRAQECKEGTRIGCTDGIAYHLLWEPGGRQSLFSIRALHGLPPFSGLRVVYAEACTVGAARLKAANVVFKQIPYAVQTT